MGIAGDGAKVSRELGSVSNDQCYNGTIHLMNNNPSSNCCVADVTTKDLANGLLVDRFRQGAKAIVFNGDERIQWLYDAMVTNEAGHTTHLGLPWHEPLEIIARNHIPGDTHIGDMIRFVPPGFAHFARKIAILQEEPSGPLRTIPESFSTDSGRKMVDQRIAQTAWDLATDIFRGFMAPDVRCSPYVVLVEVIGYPKSSNDVDRTTALIRDAAAGWTRLGQRLDSEKARLACAGYSSFSRSLDILALSSLVPGLRLVTRRILSNWERRRINATPPGFRVIASPHIDGSKILTCLAGDRETVRTEIRSGDEWIELPVVSNALAVFPSFDIAKYAHIDPTEHRVLMDTTRVASKNNVTLTLTVADRSAFEPVRQCYVDSVRKFGVT